MAIRNPPPEVIKALARAAVALSELLDNNAPPSSAICVQLATIDAHLKALHRAEKQRNSTIWDGWPMDAQHWATVINEAARNVVRVWNKGNQSITFHADDANRVNAGDAQSLARAGNKLLGIVTKTDSKTDKQKKSKALVPRNADVAKLAKKIKREQKQGVSKLDIALSFTNGNRSRADSLLRQLRSDRFKHLLDA